MIYNMSDHFEPDINPICTISTPPAKQQAEEGHASNHGHHNHDHGHSGLVHVEGVRNRNGSRLYVRLVALTAHQALRDFFFPACQVVLTPILTAMVFGIPGMCIASVVQGGSGSSTCTRCSVQWCINVH